MYIQHDFGIWSSALSQIKSLIEHRESRAKERRGKWYIQLNQIYPGHQQFLSYINQEFDQIFTSLPDQCYALNLIAGIEYENSKCSVLPMGIAEARFYNQEVLKRELRLENRRILLSLGCSKLKNLEKSLELLEYFEHE